MLPLEFVVQGIPVRGRSRDLSEKGLFAFLEEPVLAGTQGRVRLQIESCSVEIAAEVAYAELREVGLRFEFRSTAEQAFVQMLVKVVSRTAGKAGYGR